MRLDAHTHTYSNTLEKWPPNIESTGVTHYVAIMRDADLVMIPKLDEAGAHGIPFHWLDLSKADPFIEEVEVAGYKLHLRQTPPRGNRPLYATKEDLGHICERAAREHRPLLFHTDGDDPNPSSVPMLAQLCRDYPDTTIIAGHMGVYTQERFITQYQAEVFAPMLEPLWRMHVRLVLETPNLYGDITKFGMDYPWRAPHPLARFDAFRKVVQQLPAAERVALHDKLFVGTDFPHFWKTDEEESACLQDPTIVPASHYGFQAECMARAFGELFDEDRMAENFFRLLPEGFRP